MGWIEITDKATVRRERIPRSVIGGNALLYSHGDREIMYVDEYMKVTPLEGLQEGDYKADVHVGIPGISEPRVEIFVKLPAWMDITEECVPKLVTSQHSKGQYIMLVHKGNDVALLGHGGIILAGSLNGKYKIEKPKNARISFRILKKSFPHK